ncbi:hypothetical protein [Sinorhizobium fredii]|uniref:hypothetical protein n=1 Tax=Rhizobium fredii TaxID=380 RepID=UPI001297097B|nr:hypothetical protein [Sinorhizobium fredii]MQW94074.1 hypothetical protein [Sinorhizobium fredii]
MAIVLTKKKIEPAAYEEPDVSAFAALIDKVGQLQAEAEKTLARIKLEQDRLKPYKQALAELQAKIDALDLGPDAIGEELGFDFKVEVGKKGSARRVTDLKKVRELMGDELFYACATVTLKDLDNYLTGPQREQVLVTDRTSRAVKVVKRG